MTRKLLFRTLLFSALAMLACAIVAGMLPSPRPAYDNQAQAGPIHNLIDWIRNHRHPPQPVPPAPVPPAPEPTPDPVPPAPPTPPTPITGLRVLICGPSPRAVRDLSPDQAALLTSRTFRDWTDAACEKSPGGIPAFRILSKSASLPADWADLAALAPSDRCALVAVMPNKPALVLLPLPDTATAIAKLTEYSGVAKALPRLPPAPRCRELSPERLKALAGAGGKVTVDGKVRFLTAKPRDKKKHPYGSAPGTVPLSATGVRIIPRSEWPAYIAARKAANAGLMALTYGKVPCSDQNGLGYCWVHSSKNSWQTTAYTQGFGSIELSAVSIGGPLTGYRNEGGWPADSIRFLKDTGGVRTSLWPENDLDSRYAKRPEVQADYPRHKIADTIADLGASGKMFDEVATCLLLGCPCAVSYDWWQHAVEGEDIQQEASGKYSIICRNSWGDEWSDGDNGFFAMPEGKGTPDDAQAVMLVNAESPPAKANGVPVTIDVRPCPSGTCPLLGR